jgi:hypothetical protein
VEPSITNLSLRLFAGWQAIANLPAGFDPSFTDSMAIWLKGSMHEHAFGKCTGFGKCDDDVNGKDVITVVEF